MTRTVRWRSVLSWTALLGLAILAFGADHALSQATLVATYALAGLGVVVVVGQAGQIALGQAALVGLGAYTEALLVTAGVPSLLAIPAAAAIAAAGGALASLPARRLGGLYFGMSTLAFALIVEEALVRWESVTRGAAGLAVPALQLAGQAVESPASQALVSAAALIGAMLLCTRLFDSRLGRAWRAVREDEAAADACGVDPVRAKLLAFVVGGALSGVAGALYAHWIGFISPDQFGLMFSFELLMLAFIGGAQRQAGAAWGALVIVAIPQAISVLRDALPGELARSAGLETVVFGAVIVAVVLLRPRGIAGGR